MYLEGVRCFSLGQGPVSDSRINGKYYTWLMAGGDVALVSLFWVSDVGSDLVASGGWLPHTVDVHVGVGMCVAVLFGLLLA